jgi:hypothetical protein
MTANGGDNPTPITRRDKMATALAEHAHVWTIMGVGAVFVAYVIRHTFVSQTKAALIGDTIQLGVASVGSIGSLLALIMIGLLKSADFGKLEKFQTYIILGIGVSVLVSGLAVLNSLGLVVFAQS